MTPDILRRWDLRVPRYTSYPPADRFDDAFGPTQYGEALARVPSGDPLSLYVHLPFCPERCTYCACTMIVTQRRAKMQAYLQHLLAEVDLVVDTLGAGRRVVQLHLGGGTPNAYEPRQLAELVAGLRERFALEPGAELAIEVDPRLVRDGTTEALAAIGFNRLSMGVQDLDPVVQVAIGRIQPREVTAQCLLQARAAGFRSVSVDFVYGLPHQTQARFSRSLGELVDLRPDRVALFGFAYLPAARPHQRAIDPGSLPGGAERMELFCMARERLLTAGYVAIGMDHFALPSDSLGQALEAGTLRRNFQGYTVLDADAVIGLGASSIGFVGGAFCQNARKLSTWRAAIDAGRLPTVRGLRLTEDDLLRRRLIEDVMCRFEVPVADARRAAGAADRLQALIGQGLVERSGDTLRATELGRVLVRLLAACFDPAMAVERPAAAAPYAPVV